MLCVLVRRCERIGNQIENKKKSFFFVGGDELRGSQVGLVSTKACAKRKTSNGRLCSGGGGVFGFFSVINSVFVCENNVI